MDKKLDDKIDRALERVKKIAADAGEAAADAAVERVVGTVWERAAYDASVLSDKHRALEERLQEHISDENLHLTPGPGRR
jgi:hypothetical protein